MSIEKFLLPLKDLAIQSKYRLYSRQLCMSRGEYVFPSNDYCIGYRESLVDGNGLV